MKKITLLFVAFVVFGFTGNAQTPQQKLVSLFDKNNKEILVAAHRGDWRNEPENSLRGLQNCIQKGIDLVELDLKMTKDSVLVVMHDNTLDRTTNAKGKISDYTFDQIKVFRLKNGLGRVTTNAIPTFLEMMEAAKGKILINVDKGNTYLPQVFEVLKQTNTMDQAIVNVTDNTQYDKLKAENNIPEGAYLMVVVGMKNDDALSVIASYKANKRAIIQPIFDQDNYPAISELPKISKDQVIWLNSLWPSLNGGHDDDTAVEENKKDESWGWLIDKKATILQSDRPIDLILYLRGKKLHK
ncbi:glycerophosphodiester phosphodiesterase family protein [Pedobacter fastidiosus]|uniref:Glycerophosphodiester phosphodiesterase family protein n=1 Tax=Pedobacter fastidiosus TaxID=2765361 RepID=A0ABR7KNS0_9SPHI|nr:glycerophosphodiester phosphodiesterase family protein [Pedobacter fastidiosus]MBC6109696.1 glycerophosphodiester phosphodiesterase family protein [Pedobacter fastidiosus]